MQIYLSYKQTWIEKSRLLDELLFFKSNIEKTWNNIFIYYLQENNELPPKELDMKFLEKIKESDLVLAYINYSEKSEWQLLELGMAYALNKKILILINEKIEKNYYLTYGLWKVIKFQKLEYLDFKKIINGIN